MDWVREFRKIDSELGVLCETQSSLGGQASWHSDLNTKAAYALFKRLVALHPGVPKGDAQSAFWEVLEIFRKAEDWWPGSLPEVIARAGILKSRILGELTSKEPEWVRAVERAFLHLQRRLAVEASIKSQWESEFSGPGKTETDLEALGAVHLLGHGLYAFKANSSGQRTDLILGEGPDLQGAERAGTPLVLTEWKKVEGEGAAAEKDLAEKTKSAIHQLGKYTDGALAGAELRQTCFAVFVSLKDLKTPEDQMLSSGVRVRCVNVAVTPTRPSNPKVAADSQK